MHAQRQETGEGGRLPSPADALTVNVQPPEPGENKSLSSEPPGPRCSVGAARADERLTHSISSGGEQGVRHREVVKRAGARAPAQTRWARSCILATPLPPPMHGLHPLRHTPLAACQVGVSPGLQKIPQGLAPPRARVSHAWCKHSREAPPRWFPTFDVTDCSDLPDERHDTETR